MRTALALAALTMLGCTAAPRAATPAPASTVHIQVLALNDFHGNLAPPHGRDGTVAAADGSRVVTGGAAYLAAHVHRLARENPNTVVVSAGDLTGASPLVSNLFHDEPTVLLMNSLGLSFEAVGNHDFDRGIGELQRLQRGGASALPPGVPGLVDKEPFGGAKFTYLAANVFGPDGKTVFPAYAVRELAGVKLAFVGMTLEGTPTVTTREAISGLRFANEAATVNALLPELRAQGVAATVVVVHEGGTQDDKGTFDSCSGFTGDILRVVKDLDPSLRVVVSGHTHQAYDCTIDGRLLTSAASYGRLITQIDLALDPVRRELVDAHARNVPVTRDIAPDPEVARLVAAYEEKARPVTDRIVGHQRGPLGHDPRAVGSASCEHPMGDVIADAQLAATAGAGADLALMNPGGVRADLVPPQGQGDVTPIRYGAAFEVQPFANRLVTVTLTGKELQTILERQFGRTHRRVLSVSQGFTYRYRYDATSHTASVDAESMRLRGKPVEPAARYRVTVNSFLADGGDEFGALRDAPDRTPGPVDIDALVDYLTRTTSAAAPLTAPPLTRVTGNGCE